MKKIALLFLLVFCSCSFVYAGNYALLFDGDNDYVDIPDSDYSDFTKTMTIEAWLKPINNHHSGLNPAAPEVVVSKWTSESPLDYAYQLKTRHNDQTKIYFEASDEPGVGPYMINLEGNYTAPDYQWTHLAAVFDVDHADIYYNGILGGTAQSIPKGDGDITKSVQDIFIGAAHAGGVTENFPGYIDEVRLWDVARTQQEIQDWMYHPLYGNESGLVGYYNFDNGSGQVLTDLVHGINGRLGSTTGIDGYDPQWVLSDVPLSSVVATPEPATLSLFGLGLLGLALRRKKAK